jgi:hypothetical protein
MPNSITNHEPLQRRLITGLVIYEVFVIGAVAFSGISIATSGGSPLYAAIPVLVVAASEALRVPLSAWATRLSFGNKVMAMFVLACLAIASAEGLALAFDNLIAARTRIVSDAAKRVDEASAKLKTVEQKLAPTKAALQSAEHEISALDAKHSALINTPPVPPGFSGTTCRNRKGSVYGCPADTAAQKTYAATRADHARQIETLEAARKSARESVSQLQTRVAGIDIATPTSSLALANRDLSDSLEASPMHRIAASWFGVRAVDITEQQFSVFRKYAVTGLSVALASMSALVAWLAFQPANSDKQTKLSRAIRAFLARRRKPLIKTVEVPVPSGTRVVYRYVPANVEVPKAPGPMGEFEFKSEPLRAYRELL